MVFLIMRGLLVVVCLVGVVQHSEASIREKRQYNLGTDVGYHNRGLARSAAHSPLLATKRCIEIHSLKNGQAVCAYSGCRLRCLPGYRFNHQTRVATLNCDHSTGALTFRGVAWTPAITICSAVCTASCQNGGTCVGPDKCACSGGYTGDTCTAERMLGDAPYGGYQLATIAANQRRVECEPGTRMPDGSTSVTLSFRDNTWFYPDGRMLLGVDQVTCSKEYFATTVAPRPDPLRSNKIDDYQPASKPEALVARPTAYVTLPSRWSAAVTRSPPTIRGYTCDRPCLNGGECLASNTCNCLRGYWGPQCQVKVCSYPRFEGNLHASLSGSLSRMVFKCHPSHLTAQGHSRVLVLCRNGQWRLPAGRLLQEEDVKCYKEH